MFNFALMPTASQIPKTLIIILLTVGMLGFGSCNRGQVYREFIDIPGYSWERDKTISFQTEISDNQSRYDLSLEVRHMSSFPYEELIVVFRVISPSGAVRSGEHRIPIKNQDGSFRASGMGDLWDLSYPLAQDITLDEAGIYTFEIDNVMPRVRVSGLMELGLSIRKSKTRGDENR